MSHRLGGKENIKTSIISLQVCGSEIMLYKALVPNVKKNGLRFYAIFFFMLKGIACFLVPPNLTPVA